LGSSTSSGSRANLPSFFWSNWEEFFSLLAALVSLFSLPVIISRPTSAESVFFFFPLVYAAREEEEEEVRERYGRGPEARRRQRRGRERGAGLTRMTRGPFFATLAKGEEKKRAPADPARAASSAFSRSLGRARNDARPSLSHAHAARGLVLLGGRHLSAPPDWY